MLRYSIFFMLILSAQAAWQAPKGWMWYSPIPKEKPLTKNEPNKPQPPLSPVERLKKLQEEFESKKALAVLQPTLPNVQAVMHLQNQMIKQADAFKEMWMLASLLETSQYQTQDNTNALHLKIEREQQKQDLDTNLKTLAQSNGLFFMFKESCPYCHAFAPVLKRFAETYGFEVKAISADGSTLPEFPKASQDNGWIDQLNPERLFPMVFLVNPHTLEVIPLVKGMTSLDELKSNAATIIDHLRRGE